MNGILQNKESQRKYHLDFLRLFALLAVVFIHVAAYSREGYGYSGLEFSVKVAYNYASKWAVPVFVMISGALFLDNGRELSVKKLYTKHILRIVTAFAFWSIIYTAANNKEANGSIKKLISMFCYGHYHMWFLFMIVGLYIIVPLLRMITKSEKMTKYFVLLSIIFTFAIPTLLNIPSLSPFGSIYSKMYFNFTLGYVGYFVLGYYFSKTELPKTSRYILYAMGVASVVLSVVSVLYCHGKGMENYDVLSNELSVFMLIVSSAIFVLFRSIFEKKQFGEKSGAIITSLSKYTFGAYLAHVLFIDLLHGLGFDNVSFNPIVSIPVISIAVYIVSMAVSCLLNNIPFVKKYFV